jgi:predicted O-linked N-acetylglucosamine transferase (SPINDLY family)
MRILQAVPGSVLWLPRDNETAGANIRAKAAAFGVAPARIIFSGRVAPEIYLARLGAADLFLDTAPYNAGTIASDALRMGLPVLTLRGQSFAGRMAASLLSAIGAPDCIADDFVGYVATAIRLATDPASHAALRARIGGDAWARTLGDTDRFVRGLEDSFRQIARSADDIAQIAA